VGVGWGAGVTNKPKKPPNPQNTVWSFGCLFLGVGWGGFFCFFFFNPQQQNTKTKNFFFFLYPDIVLQTFLVSAHKCLLGVFLFGSAKTTLDEELNRLGVLG